MAGTILQHGQHFVARQAVFCGEVDEPLAVIAAHAASGAVPVPGAEPQVAGTILQHGPHFVVDQAVFCGEVRESLAVVAAHAASGTEPQAARTVLQHGQHLVARQAVFCGEVDEPLAVVTAHAVPRVAAPVSGAEPQVAAAIFQHCPHSIARQAVPSGKGGEANPIEATYSPFVGDDPERAIGILVQIENAGMRQTVGNGIGLPHILPDSRSRFYRRSTARPDSDAAASLRLNRGQREKNESP